MPIVSTIILSLKYYLLKTYSRINLTFFTKWIGIANEPRKTDTNGSMIFCLTFGILATWMGITWILTFFLYTCKVVRAFRVNNTLRLWCWNIMHLHRNHAIEIRYNDIFLCYDWMLRNKLNNNLRGLQSVCGEPINPSGHVHNGLWFITLQIALGAQGLSSAHGLIHCRFRQAVYSGQSSSCSQPTDRTGSTGRSARIWNHAYWKSAV